MTGELERVRMSAPVRRNRDTGEWIQEGMSLQVRLYRECSEEIPDLAEDRHAGDGGDCVPFTFRAPS